MRSKRFVIGALMATLAALLLTGGLTGAMSLPGRSADPPEGARAAVVAPGLGSVETVPPGTSLLAEVPELVNFQGVLTNPATGDPVGDGIYLMDFSIWTLPTGGAMLWSESQPVEVSGGLFNVLLGSFAPLPAGVFTGAGRYLEVRVDADPPMTPRHRFAAVPYAFYAEGANVADSVPWSGLTSVPAGFADDTDDDVLGGLSCADGQVAKWNNAASQWECANDVSGGGDFWALTGNSGTNPSTNFVGTTDSQPLVLSTNGSEAMRIDTSGNVGIGTSSPQEQLDVAGAVRISQPTAGAHPWALGAWANSFTGEGVFFIKDLDTGSTRLAIDQNTGDVGVMGGGSFSVDFGGVVGRILLSTPAGAGPGVIAYSPNGNRRDIRFDNEGMRLLTSSSSSSPASANGIRIDQSGRVGIGTSGPASKLDAVGNRIRLRASEATGAKEIALRTDGAVVDLEAKNADLWLRSVSGNTIMQAWGGSVGIGTGSPGAKLEVKGTSGDLLRLTNTSSPSGPTVFRVDSSGQVFADASYNCGLSSTSACLQAGQGADIAERFDASEPVEPGDVIEVDPEHFGRFRRAQSAHSPLVVGIVSSAPAITLGNEFDAQLDEWEDDRPLLALAGKVPVKVTAENGPIQAGDLLVSSSSPGYAMRCSDREACAGAIVGKALEPLEEGTGLIHASVLIR